MLDLSTAEPAPPGQGFSWANLVILLVVVAALWPLLQLARRAASRYRKDVHERDEDPDKVSYTEENDPDLRRNTRDQTS